MNDFEEFQKIKIKTLILWAEKDELFSRDIAEYFHRNIENSELKFVKGNYDWCLFDQEKFSKIVIDWLKANNY